ncbi:hypothetical protein A2U01_0001009 [Trifolium medium]|uniref:B box-type domain-containing protein n=1 Tax=Trifolium medium TaxID=97028 RepID=A0A392LZ13_9FABA|nr:hypothetical protein [Trifolium medium]
MEVCSTCVARRVSLVCSARGTLLCLMCRARVCSLCTQRESVEMEQDGGAGHDFGSLVSQRTGPGSGHGSLGPVQNNTL